MVNGEWRVTFFISTTAGFPRLSTNYLLPTADFLPQPGQFEFVGLLARVAFYDRMSQGPKRRTPTNFKKRTINARNLLKTKEQSRKQSGQAGMSQKTKMLRVYGGNGVENKGIVNCKW